MWIIIICLLAFWAWRRFRKDEFAGQWQWYSGQQIRDDLYKAIHRISENSVNPLTRKERKEIEKIWPGLLRPKVSLFRKVVSFLSEEIDLFLEFGLTQKINFSDLFRKPDSFRKV